MNSSPTRSEGSLKYGSRCCHRKWATESSCCFFSRPCWAGKTLNFCLFVDCFLCPLLILFCLAVWDRKEKCLLISDLRSFKSQQLFFSTAFCSHSISIKIYIWVVLVNVLICKQLFPSSSGIMKPGLNAILGPTGSGKSSWVPSVPLNGQPAVQSIFRILRVRGDVGYLHA